MSDVQFIKVVGTLPAQLAPNTFYFVRTGAGFDLHLTDSTGTVAHTLNGLDDPMVQVIQDEIFEARAGRSSLNDRISVISNFASTNTGPFIPGRWYDNSFHAANSANYGIAGNRVEITPFYCSQPLAIDRIGVNVTTVAAAGGGLGRLLIYESDEGTGLPANLRFESADLDFSLTTGLVGHTFSSPFVFERAKTYWLGIRLGVATGMVVRALATTSTMTFGLLNETASAYCTMLRKTLAWGGPTPDPWVPENSDYVNGTPASIRMRAVAIPVTTTVSWLHQGAPISWTSGGDEIEWTGV